VNKTQREEIPHENQRREEDGKTHVKKRAEVRGSTDLSEPRLHRYLFPRSFNLVGINGQDGNRRSSDHISRHTSENNMLQALPSVGSHHHQVDFFGLDGSQNFLGRIAVNNLLLKAGTTLQLFLANFFKGLFSATECVFSVLLQGDMGGYKARRPIWQNPLPRGAGKFHFRISRKETIHTEKPLMNYLLNQWEIIFFVF